MDGLTMGEYEKETTRILMGDVYRPHPGYVLQDVRTRVLELLDRERRAKEICDRKLFKKINVPCPYCGWTHS